MELIGTAAYFYGNVVLFAYGGWVVRAGQAVGAIGTFVGEALASYGAGQGISGIDIKPISLLSNTFWGGILALLTPARVATATTHELLLGYGAIGASVTTAQSFVDTRIFRQEYDAGVLVSALTGWANGPASFFGGGIIGTAITITLNSAMAAYIELLSEAGTVPSSESEVFLPSV